MGVITLNLSEIETLISIANQFTFSPSENPDLFCKEAKTLSLQVPDRIRKSLLSFVLETDSNEGFLLIQNIPIDDSQIPNTPHGNMYKVGETTILARIQAILLNVVGEMIAYEAEGYGRLFQDVVPMKDMSMVQTSLGSRTELEIHTEQAFSKLRPDILSLACLRGDPEARTYILPVEYILENLSTDEIECLREPLWKTRVDMSFKLNGHEFIEGDIRGPLSILNCSSNNTDSYSSLKKPIITFDQDLMTGITPESQQMIHKIVDIYYKHRIAHILKPGEIAWIDNRYAVHGRSAFSPKYDGYDRFLIRAFATLDYSKSEYARPDGNRMVYAVYS